MKHSAYIRYTVALVALLMGFALSIRASERGFLFESPGAELLANPPATPDGYDLQALTILNRVLLQMGDNYVEPDRIDAHRMLVYALDRVQNSVPEVVALFNADMEASPTEVEIRVADQTEVFEIGAIASLWEMSFKLREVFRFLQEHLDPEAVDLRDIEYNACNGLLGTLDPHSVLLTPDVYEEMQASNRGSFGGLGIVISIRDGQLTVISPVPDTPAARAGFLAGDRIVKINNESTVNMPLDEAVSRLRGPEGSDVTVEIMRPGWTEPHSFTLTREIIDIESVSHQALGDGIGYVEIRNFQGNTHEHLVEALDTLTEDMGGINGLILDLRNNPGGLLQQAIEVTDTFLSSGTIVTTVGVGDRLREENPANPTGTQPDYPIIVLVNAGSASASEIVAGALKNHNRALIVGDTTFGKGTVQVLYEFHDGSALKLTIAQYLTPGDVSIQGVGIVPDIQIVPVTISDNYVDLYQSERTIREGDFDTSLTNDNTRDDGERPAAVVKYYQEPPEDSDPDAIDDPDAFETDFEIDFARQLLIDAGETFERSAMLGVVGDTIESVAALQMVAVQEELRNRNVDWTPGENVIQPVTMSISTNYPGDSVSVGDTLQLTVSVTNDGDRELHQVRAVSESDYNILDDREFVFGMLAPGATATWTVPIDVPIEDWTRHGLVTMHAYADMVDLETATEAYISVVGRARPQFGLSYVFDDREGGNGDGQLQVGEDVVMHVEVFNVGTGDASETVVYLRNEAEAALFLRTGRSEVELLEAGGRHHAEFEFTVQEMPETGSVSVDLEVYDMVFREFLSEEITLTVTEESVPLAASSGHVVAGAQGATVLNAPTEDALRVATIPAGAQLNSTAGNDDYYRVEWGDFMGFVARDAAAFASGDATSPAAPALSIQFQAPVIILADSVTATADESVLLTGTIGDDSLVRDYYVMVYSRTPGAARAQSTKRVYEFLGANSAEIEATIPLHPGMNRITFVARDDDDASSSEIVYIYREATP